MKPVKNGENYMSNFQKFDCQILVSMATIGHVNIT